MSDLVKPPAVPTHTPFKFDEAKFKDLLTNQENYLRDFIGKKGHNPFFALEIVGNLYKRYAKGERTEDLMKAATALEKKAPMFGSVPPSTAPVDSTPKPI